jgi:16S rRNA (cytosine1402-N4)-methyltransferase
MARSFRHDSVLLTECLELLAVGPGGTWLDGTVGGGGHAEAILEASAPDGRLLGLDVDEDALAAAGERLSRFGGRVTLLRASFRELDRARVSQGLPAPDGVLLDLGVSSPQLDEPERGFRFSPTASDVPLDMRMDRSAELSARELLDRASEAELAGWFREYGELPGSKRLARALVQERRRGSLRTAADLVRVIEASGIGRGRRHHPATLVFQALRIAVNDELGALDEGLEQALAGLRAGGRLAVISYHSLEDRRVKNFIRDEVRGCVCPPRLPECRCGRRPRLGRITRKPVRPGPDEVAANPRARSARLRVAERLPEDA